MTGFIQQSTGRALRMSLLSLLPISILAAWPFIRERPDYSAMPDALVDVPLKPIAVASPKAWSLHGAWDIDAVDPRVAGLSGLDCGGGSLHVVTDMGSYLVLDAPAPRADHAPVLIAQLENIRDGEAIVLYFGNLLVAEEHQHRVSGLTPGGIELGRTELPRNPHYANSGIEALLGPGEGGNGVIAFNQDGKLAYRIVSERSEPIVVSGAWGRITDAARGPRGEAYVLQSRLDMTGFSGAISRISIAKDTIRVGPPMRLPTGPRANPEGLCIEPRGADSTQLWVVTDDNALAPLANRLIAWDVSQGKLPKPATP